MSSPSRPLISVAGLASRLGSAEPPALLDVRWRLGGPPGIDSYLAGHLPGACFVDLDEALAGPPGSGAGGRHPLPEPAVFETAMRAAGLRQGQPAVVYDEGDATIAARLWWLLRYFGHDQVAVLDGGLGAWGAAGLPITTELPDPERGTFTAGPGGGMPVLDDAEAARIARSGFLLDARAAERYRGEVEPVDPAAGHIPGAISAPARGKQGPDAAAHQAQPGHPPRGPDRLDRHPGRSRSAWPPSRSPSRRARRPSRSRRWPSSWPGWPACSLPSPRRSSPWPGRLTLP